MWPVTVWIPLVGGCLCGTFGYRCDGWIQRSQQHRPLVHDVVACSSGPAPVDRSAESRWLDVLDTLWGLGGASK